MNKIGCRWWTGDDRVLALPSRSLPFLSPLSPSLQTERGCCGFHRAMGECQLCRCIAYFMRGGGCICFPVMKLVLVFQSNIYIFIIGHFHYWALFVLEWVHLITLILIASTCCMFHVHLVSVFSFSRMKSVLQLLEKNYRIQASLSGKVREGPC